MSQPAPNFIPRGAVIGMTMMVLFSLGVTAAARLSGGPERPADGVALHQRDLRFADMADGGIEVTDGRGAPVAVLDPGTNGFIRGALRGLVRERWRDDHGPAIPFRLTVWQDGRLTLDDPATGHRVDLRAFGQTNAEAFRRLLTSGEDKR